MIPGIGASFAASSANETQAINQLSANATGGNVAFSGASATSGAASITPTSGAADSGATSSALPETPATSAPSSLSTIPSSVGGQSLTTWLIVGGIFLILMLINKKKS